MIQGTGLAMLELSRRSMHVRVGDTIGG